MNNQFFQLSLSKTEIHHESRKIMLVQILYKSVNQENEPFYIIKLNLIFTMGNQVELNLASKTTTCQQHKYFKVATSSMRGWRQYMQDAHLVVDPLGGDESMSLFAVFDGHGGPETAIFAKLHFSQCLLKNKNFINKQYELALKQTFIQIDNMMKTPEGVQEVTKIRAQQVEKKNAIDYEGQTLSGCTANVILLTSTHIYCANSGDSRSIAYLKTKIRNRYVQQLSFDHKPFVPRERQRIIKAGGQITMEGRINGCLNLSRGLGDFIFKQHTGLDQSQQMVTCVPDIVKIQRNNVDFILMGCDGIWERKTCDKMGKFVKKSIQKYRGNLQKAVEKILNQQLGMNIYDQLGMDNMTAIIIRFY